MLVVHNNQMKLLAESQRELFLAEMCSHVRTHFPEEMRALNDDLLEEMVAQTIDRATRSYGLETRRDLCVFLSLCAHHGWAFDHHPGHDWMRAALSDPRVPSASDRLRWLLAENRLRLETAAVEAQLLESFKAVTEAT